MNKFILLFFLLCFFGQASAIPAYPNRIFVNVSDKDSVAIFLRGDESFKYAFDEEGYGIVQSSGTWYYLKEEGKNVVCSDYKLTSKKNRSIETESFLRTTNKGLMPERSLSSGDQLTRGAKSEIRYSKATNSPIESAKILVVLVQFPDCIFNKSKEDFESLFNQRNYQEDGALGSVRDYYLYASNGILDLECDIIGPYTTNNSMSYYGGNVGMNSNDKNPMAMFREALNFAQKTVNLSDYDIDNDGYIDNIHIIYAGYGEEAGGPSNAIWAHESTMDDILVGDKIVNKYSCAPELRGNKGNGISRIGPHCHEIGHALGAPDFYDVDYSKNGSYFGTGEWDIMASGSWNLEGAAPANFNPYVKAYIFHWSDVQVLDHGQFTISPSFADNTVFRVNTIEYNDFYLLENRGNSLFDQACPGEGLLIYHIGPGIKYKSRTNTVNNTFPQMCYVVCASSKYANPNNTKSSYGEINSDGCPYPGSSGNNSFSEKTIPASYCISASPSGVSITDICQNSDATISLYVECDISIVENNQYLWAEDFENMNYSFWTNEKIIGKATWGTIKGNGSNTSPTPPHGKYIEALTPPSSSIFEGNSSYKSRLISEVIDLGSAEDGVLSFWYRYYSGNSTTTNDSLIFLTRENESDTWTTISQRVLQKKNEWICDSLAVNSNSNRIQIAIDGRISSKSSIFVDNMKLKSLESPSLLSIISIPQTNKSLVYVDGSLRLVAPVGVSSCSYLIYSLSGVIVRRVELKSDEVIYLDLPQDYYILQTL